MILNLNAIYWKNKGDVIKMEQALKIYRTLLEQGEINRQKDRELFQAYTEHPEIKNILEKFEIELGFRIVETPRTLYLVANIENKVMSFSLRELREAIKGDAKLIDTFLICYIIMFILYLFYGGKNADPKQADFLQLKDIVSALDERFEKIDEDAQSLLEEDYSINFRNIADEWKSKIADGSGRATRRYMVKRACDILEKQKLVFYPNGENGEEIRPEEKLDNLMRYYYLLEDRIKQLNQIFMIGDEENA